MSYNSESRERITTVCNALQYLIMRKSRNSQKNNSTAQYRKTQKQILTIIIALFTH